MASYGKSPSQAHDPQIPAGKKQPGACSLDQGLLVVGFP